MLNKLLFGSAQHEHADPAQRLLGVAELAPDAPALAQLLAADPAPEVRAAAAARCVDAVALAAAWREETEPAVRAAIASSLGRALATSADVAAARSLLAASECTDAIRAAVALAATDETLRRAALEGVTDEQVLVDIALAAELAPVRLAAAERVQTPEPLRRLAEAARDKDRGVARIARQRLDAIEHRAQQAAAADALLAEAEALAERAGPIVMAAVELDRRWHALDLGDDAVRRARWEQIGARLRARFEREHEAQRARAAFQRRLNEWLAALQSAPATSLLPALRGELLALREQAQQLEDGAALAQLEQAEQRIAQWEQAAPALASAEALVAEAERLAAETPIDDAGLPRRWQALDLSVRTPELTRRFEAALLVIERRRLALVRAAQQQEGAVRQRLHVALHAAEQALAAGQLHEARAAAGEARELKSTAGLLPKPTVQRLARVVQQLRELERWESFGQQTARIQLCERAEALARQTLPPAALAREVQQLRAEWKKLDEQHAGVPKPLWERFDSACEKAYAPAARHFAELAAQHKQARKQREEFIAAAAAHAPALLAEPRDWRAIERWLREADATWHGPSLGSVEPGAWKKLDARFKAAVAPLRDALSGARAQAKSERQALIAEAQALAAQALERDTPAKVKALQARWQAQAKHVPLAPRDERVLWEQFRAACNAVFEARASARRQADCRQQEQRRAFEVLCEQLEQLARASDVDEAQIRRARHEVLEQWKRALAENGPAPAALDGRFRAARTRIEAALGTRMRRQQAAVWHALLAKESLCAELDARVIAGEADRAAADSVRERWATLPPLAPAMEQKLLARRDVALAVLARLQEEYVREDHLALIEKAAPARRDALLELELLLGLDSPADLQPQRLAVQVKQLRGRFKEAAPRGAASVGAILLEWCALPGVADARDRQRCERIAAALSSGAVVPSPPAQGQAAAKRSG
ncbi:MAG: DUF349 domain-containing protein [Burkholderiaceae bacterium]|nr:DUF349 domain-containing protein [Burkholderiaceae bacterium]